LRRSGNNGSDKYMKVLKRNRNKMKGTKAQKVALWVVAVFFFIYALTLIYPFVYILLNSFKTNSQIFDDPLGFPQSWTFDNYKNVLNGTAFDSATMGEMFLNSITLTLGETVVSMLLSCMAAYVLSKYKFRGNDFIFTMVIVLSLVPNVASLPATYKLMSELGMINTYIGMIVLQCGAFGSTFMYLYATFKTISWSYAESAMIDGASNSRIFFKIYMPLARNAILTFTIIRFLGFWNDYWLPSLFYDEHPTLAVGLASLSSEASTTGAFAPLFAAMVIAVIPIFIFYAIFQKQLMGNISAGGIKE